MSTATPPGTAAPVTWVELQVDPNTDEVKDVQRTIPADEWGQNGGPRAVEAQALIELARAEGDQPFRFVEPSALCRIDERGADAFALATVTTRYYAFELNALLDMLKGRKPPPQWAKKHLRMSLKLLIAELSAQRQTNLALRQELVQLRRQLGTARNAALHEAA
ncbi:MAG: hypothetical protein LCH62_01655 [Proteobacteria bacterium]|nr:hypothetical protein [Pseudomonadota bacterium]